LLLLLRTKSSAPMLHVEAIHTVRNAQRDDSSYCQLILP
jgi:hypothetical protein